MVVSVSQAQPLSPSPPPPPPTATPVAVKPAKPHPPAPAASPKPGIWDPQAFMSTMTPEQRQKFLQNLERWKKLPPEQQAELRRTEEFRQKRILGEINEAIALSGLKLDQDGRQVFAFRYAQERRTIEDSLRKEMEDKRHKAVDNLIKQLVTEFRMVPPKRPALPPRAGPSTPAPVPSPTPIAAALK